SMRYRQGVIGSLVLTYLAVLVGQVFFRASSSGSAISMIAGMGGLHGIEATGPGPFWLPDSLGAAGSWLKSHNIVSTMGQFESGGTVFYQVALMVLLYLIVFFANNSQQIVGLAAPEKPTTVYAMRFLVLSRRWGFDIKWGVIVGLVGLASI